MITNVTFPVCCRAEGRIFHTAGVLLEPGNTNHRWLPQQMWLCTTALWAYKGFNENLATFQAWSNPPGLLAHAHIGQAANVHPVDARARVKSSYLETKSNLYCWMHRFRAWNLELWHGMEVGQRNVVSVWKCPQSWCPATGMKILARTMAFPAA